MGAEGAKAWKRAELAVIMAGFGDSSGERRQGKSKDDLEGHTI